MSDIELQRDREDYDSRADQLWSVYNKEAEFYDRALMETWKDDMDSIIIFAGLFSAVLTAFLVDTLKRLKFDPVDRTNALLDQTVFLLTQISQQLGPNGSQIVISSPQPLEAFQLTNSNLRINIFWFMSLGFSLTAALGATLVQQWVRDYLQVFQRPSGSLGRSRMRQFLFHGLTSNYIRTLVELIPFFIHISLFLFFIGLADNLFATNSTVAITSSAIIGFCALFYIVCSVFPVFYTPTPYHTPLSQIFWRIVQTAHLRKYSNNDTGGKTLPVSVDMAIGRFQIAMSDDSDRMTRDIEAIRWVLTIITEDREFEPFVAGIAGSVATPWGRDVWENIFKRDREGKTNNGHISPFRVSNATYVLRIRIESLLNSCADSTFLDQQTRFTRACVCIDAVASLKLGLGDGVQFDVDNDLMTQVLLYFGQEKKRREKLEQDALPQTPITNSAPRLEDQITGTLLEIKWKCMMILAMKKILQDPDIADAVQGVLEQLRIRRPINPKVKGDECQNFLTKNDVKNWLDENRNLNDERQEEVTARQVDREVMGAWSVGRALRTYRLTGQGVCSNLDLNEPPTEDKLTKDAIKTIQESLNALLYRAQLADYVDLMIINLVNCLMRKTCGILEDLGSASFEWPLGVTRPGQNPIFSEIHGAEQDSLELGPYCVAVVHDNKWIMPHLLPPRMLMSNLLIYASPRFAATTDPMSVSQNNLNLPGLGAELLDRPEIGELMTGNEPGPFEKQLWRLRDLRDGGIAFVIELFFKTFTIKPMALTPESKQLIEATLRAITENGKCKSLKHPACQHLLRSLRDGLEEAQKNVASNPGSTRGLLGFIVDILQKLTRDVIQSNGYLKDEDEKEGEGEEAQEEEEEDGDGEDGEGEEEQEQEEERVFTEDDDPEGAGGLGRYIQHMVFNQST